MNSMKQAIMKRRMKMMGSHGEEEKESEEEQEETKAAGLAPEREGEESCEMPEESMLGMEQGEESGEEPILGEEEVEITGDMPEEEMLKMAEMLYEKDHAGKPSIMGKAADRMKMMLSKRCKI